MAIQSDGPTMKRTREFYLQDDKCPPVKTSLHLWKEPQRRHCTVWAITECQEGNGNVARIR